jgi:hypothetical protein
MGAVYRAHDSHSRQRVALKLLLPSSSPESLQRFAREASLLEDLSHPGIVSHVAHGLTEQGQPFMAMEWLEGEDLAQRLARQPLSLAETLSLMRRAAQALAAVHQRGILHRDLKPSNLFLRAGNPEDVVLLDFGLARHVQPSLLLTNSGAVLGTPAYMAPEQASCEGTLTPAVDLFSLGCVFYECLTGKPPFSAPHFAAVLAKILFAQPPPLRTLRPDLPDSLQDLMDRLLAKDVRQRLSDASHLVPLIPEPGALDSDTDRRAPESPKASIPLGAEQQLVSVLLASPPAVTALDSHWTHPDRAVLLNSLRSLVAPYGGRTEPLADGSLVTTLMPKRGTATDQAALAARCALLIKESWPEALVVLTTGRGMLQQHLPVGEAMDRAGQLLSHHTREPDSSRLVVLDETTAGLLGSGFQLSRPRSGTFLLHGEHAGSDASRPLLGRPTPCVGRERELSMLEFCFSSCSEEPVAQALLVTAPAGMGKSRLRHEFLLRVERRSPEALVLMGRGDPMSVGAAGGVLGQALRRVCGILDGESLEVRRAKLGQRLARHVPAAQAQEVIEFLGELCGLPLPDEASPRLRAARSDPRLMSAQVSRALVAFLRAECALHPVLMVIEDLHWSDALTVKHLDEALQELADQPFMVLALARPEVKELFPGLWSRRLQELPLRGLSKKACARLAQEVLGSQLSEATVQRIVEQAAGNALFLEELIRGVAEGRGETAPETVLAMLQARLGRLEPEARQMLLAASFLGRSFWPGAVQSLLGKELSEPMLQHWLQHLVQLEWVERQPSSRFPAQIEYRFRHALVRDAAYELVPGSHKPTGHRLAGLWLEQAGESDPQVLAEHARLGQQPQRAISFYLRAAEQFFDRNDTPSAARCTETALTLGAQGEELRRLRALQATTALWMGDFAKLFATGDEVLAELKPGGVHWCWLANGLYTGHALNNLWEQAARYGRLLLSTRPEPEARLPYLEVLGNGVISNAMRGAPHEASPFLARLIELSAEAPPGSLLEQACTANAQGLFALYFESRLWQVCRWLEESFRGFLKLGLDRSAIGPQVQKAQALSALGDRAGAELELRESLAIARRLEQPMLNLYTEAHLGLFLSNSSEPAHREEALALANGLQVEHIQFYAGMVDTLRARLAIATSDLGEAEHQARKASERLAAFFFYQLTPQVLLSQILLTQGRTSEAREAVTPGARALEAWGDTALPTVSVYLALAEACLAQGDTQEGEAALRKALKCVRSRARDIPDEAARERFLLQVPENARTLELARQRLGEIGV